MRGKFANTILSIVLILITHGIYAQNNSDDIIKLQESVKKLQNENLKIKSEISTIKAELENSNKAYSDSIAILKQMLNENSSIITNVNTDLGSKISTTEQNANTKIETLDNSLSKNTLYWIIAVLVIAMLSILLFFILRKQLTKDKTDITSNIENTKKALEEESVKLDNKLIDLLATQMQLKKEEKQTVVSSKSEEVNHELALKVADEIIRIQKNLSNMDADTKGLKQLAASVKRIQDNFEANGYELVEMLNKPFDQGMKVSANFRPDEALKVGEQIITRIIKPQVNFKGVMIQSAQVEVSVGE